MSSLRHKAQYIATKLKLCLGQIFIENYEEIAGYFEEFLVKRWLEQDFFEEFDSFYSQKLLNFKGAHEL